MKLLITFFSFLFIYANTSTALAQSTKVKGLRVDPSYFYDDYPGKTAIQIADAITTKAKDNGFNTLFLYAYNSVYGAFYPTNYSNTAVEPGLGVQNIFNKVLQSAKAKGLKVVAVMPLNNFKKVWQNYPAWRVKKKSGYDYKPDSETFLLSAWHSNFRNWYTNFLEDFIARNPNIDGIEAVEAQVDFYWDGSVDFNQAAKDKFFKLYPNGKIGDASWYLARARGLTTLHGLMAKRAHAHGKEAYVVQTWTAGANGSLYSSASIRDGMGFGFDEIMNLSGESHFDYVMGEFMWQQWKSEYGTSVFTPQWTKTAGLAFIQRVNNRTIPLIHVELSEFEGSYGLITPTNDEFYQSLVKALETGAGVDIYDSHLLTERNAWGVARSALSLF